MKKKAERSRLQILIESRTDLDRARKLANIARTVPMEWTDSGRFQETDLALIPGCVEARFRVNTADHAVIVRTMALRLSVEMLERAGITGVSSFFLLAVRSLLGADFPSVIDEKHAAEILRLNRECLEQSEKLGVEIEAAYRDGKCERTGREFHLEDWIETVEQAQPVKTGCHPLSPRKEKWPREEYAQAAIIRLRENPELQKNISQFCRDIAEEQRIPEIATSLKKLLYEPEYKALWKQ